MDSEKAELAGRRVEWWSPGAGGWGDGEALVKVGPFSYKVTVFWDLMHGLVTVVNNTVVSLKIAQGVALEHSQ